VSNGIIAPGYHPEAAKRLAAKQDGRYLVIEIDPAYQPRGWEQRDVFGVSLSQEIDERTVTRDLLRSTSPAPLEGQAIDDVALAMVAARHTQSNSVVYAKDGMAIGVGAGQQSRIDCTRNAGRKVDCWWLRRHPNVRDIHFRKDVRRQDRINWRLRVIEGDMSAAEQDRLSHAVISPPKEVDGSDRKSWLASLDGVALASDGFIPFRDNIDEAARHGVTVIADPGGSARAADVVDACREHAIVLIATGLRLFQH